MPEGEATLLVWNVIQEWPHGARGLATGRLNPDHVRPHIGQELAAVNPCWTCQVQDSIAAQGLLGDAGNGRF